MSPRIQRVEERAPIEILATAAAAAAAAAGWKGGLSLGVTPSRPVFCWASCFDRERLLVGEARLPKNGQAHWKLATTRS